MTSGMVCLDQSMLKLLVLRHGSLHSISCMSAGTSVDRISDTLAGTQLGGSAQQSLTDSSFPQQSSNRFIVLLHNEAAKSVRLHDVVDVIGVLDPLMHEDGAHMDVQDDFDEFMEEADVVDEAVDAENMGGNENSAVPSPRRPKVSTTMHIFAFLIDDLLSILAVLFSDTTCHWMSCNSV